MCEADASWGTPDNRVPRTVNFDPKTRTFGNHLVGGLLVITPSVCLALPYKVINQSVVGLSPLSETA
jgi:hypothetical protein